MSKEYVNLMVEMEIGKEAGRRGIPYLDAPGIAKETDEVSVWEGAPRRGSNSTTFNHLFTRNIER